MALSMLCVAGLVAVSVQAYVVEHNVDAALGWLNAALWAWVAITAWWSIFDIQQANIENGMGFAKNVLEAYNTMSAIISVFDDTLEEVADDVERIKNRLDEQKEQAPDEDRRTEETKGDEQRTDEQK